MRLDFVTYYCGWLFECVAPYVDMRESRVVGKRVGESAQTLSAYVVAFQR